MNDLTSRSQQIFPHVSNASDKHKQDLGTSHLQYIIVLQVYYLHGNFPSVYVPVDILTSQLQAANTLEDQLMVNNKQQTINNNNKQLRAH